MLIVIPCAPSGNGFVSLDFLVVVSLPIRVICPIERPWMATPFLLAIPCICLVAVSGLAVVATAALISGTTA